MVVIAATAGAAICQRLSYLLLQSIYELQRQRQALRLNSSRLSGNGSDGVAGSFRANVRHSGATSNDATDAANLGQCNRQLGPSKFSPGGMSCPRVVCKCSVLLQSKKC
jgi:hypothetical protein